MSLQLAPAWLQRRHWRVSVGVGLPLQLPSFPVSTEPSAAVPLIVGGAGLDGAEPRLRTAALEVWPSGLVIVTVRSPTVAPTVEMLSVRCVGSVYVTEFTVTPPSIAAAIRQEPEPGSQKPEPADEVPVSVTLTDDCPVSTLVGLVDAGAAGGGAGILPTFTPQLSVLSVYSWIVQNV